MGVLFCITTQALVAFKRSLGLDPGNLELAGLIARLSKEIQRSKSSGQASGTVRAISYGGTGVVEKGSPANN